LIHQQTRSRLEFGWWASNGPTAGYLMRLALDLTPGARDDLGGAPRSVDVQVIERASAGRFESNVSFSFRRGTSDGVASVTLSQGRPFAHARVRLSAPGGVVSALAFGDAPGARAAEEYRPMGPMEVPVSRRFRYRPTLSVDGRSPRPGWDVVWVEPRVQHAAGRAMVATMVDCWYPANHMRMVRDYAAGRTRALTEPPATTLLGAHAWFTAPDEWYSDVGRVLLANRLDSIVDSHHFEESEIWSQHGRLLAVARIVRREEEPAEDGRG
jgi:Thioesterase-like superfamily